MYTDRLGSIGKYYPYGVERPSATGNGKEKFATYFRDSETGLDYADQRYETPGSGRFVTPDPYRASGGVADPGSWNRYVYVGAEPINHTDPRGMTTCDPDGLHCYENDTVYGGGGYGGGLVGTDYGYDLNSGNLFVEHQVGNGANNPLGGAASGNAAELEGLKKARDKALEALDVTACGDLFKDKNGNFLKDASGRDLDPKQVLKGLVLAALGEGDRGYGSILFTKLDEDTQATATGVGLGFSLSGPYYNRSVITINTLYWDLGYVSENTTALLHELGHVISELSPGFGSGNNVLTDSASNSQSNTNKVRDKCIGNITF